MPRFPAIWRGAHKAIFECRKPVVVALERFAIKGGAALALAADLLLVGETAFLQVGEVRQGMAATVQHGVAAPAAQREHRRAVDADPDDGSRVRNSPPLGIAYASVPDDDVVATARRLVEELSAYPDGGLVRNKTLLRAYNDTAADDWFDRATRHTGPRVKPRPVP